MKTATVEEKRLVDVNMKLQSRQPVVGGIYRDKSGSSLVVVDIVGNKALLEYANGAIITVDVNNWQLLHAQSAAF
jgi:hypothetical protein